MNIRPARPEDVPVILRFIRELAEYERAPHEVVATEAMLRRHLFGETGGEAEPARETSGMRETRSRVTRESQAPAWNLGEAGAGPRSPAAEALIGEIDGEPRGFALYFTNFSTWLGRPGIYLEDLYVTPAARRRGLGRALLVHLARIAVHRGCGRLDWAVLNWNTPAIEFYKGLGATALEEWVPFRLTGDSLARLADSPCS